MLKSLFFLFALFLAPTIDYAQSAPTIQWQRCLGGSGYDFMGDRHSIIQTTDGNYVVCGIVNSVDGDIKASKGQQDMWAAKINNKGDVIWEKSYGGSWSDGARSISQTLDGGFILSGTASSDDSDVVAHHGMKGFIDGWIVKIDSIGLIQWSKTLGGSDQDDITDIIQTSDGGFIGVGYSHSIDGDVTKNNGAYDGWIVKLDSKGEIEWQKTYGGDTSDYFRSIIETSDHKYLVGGYSMSKNGDLTFNHGDFDTWLIKLNTKGEIEWQNCFGGSNREIISSVIEIPDRGYLLAGTTQSADGDISVFHGSTDAWLVQVSPSGNLVWQKTYGGSGKDYVSSLIHTSKNHYLMSGATTSTNEGFINHGKEDGWLLEVDTIGELLWQGFYGGSEDDFMQSVCQTQDGSYILSGYTKSNNFDVNENHGGGDAWVVKLGPHADVKSVRNTQFKLSCYPNPASEFATISFNVEESTSVSLRVRNILGEPIWQTTMSCLPYSHHELPLDISDLATGRYFVTIETGGFAHTVMMQKDGSR